MKNFLLICCLSFIACNNQDASKETPTDSTAVDSIIAKQKDSIVTPACYSYQTSNNIVFLTLTTIHPAVTGHLTYDFMGKDKNDGTIEGTISGDTLFANYRFTSEGKESLREVAFLKRGDSFIEGTAEMKEKGNTMVFSNKDSLSFTGLELKPAPCM